MYEGRESHSQKGMRSLDKECGRTYEDGDGVDCEERRLQRNDLNESRVLSQGKSRNEQGRVAMFGYRYGID